MQQPHRIKGRRDLHPSVRPRLLWHLVQLCSERDSGTDAQWGKVKQVHGVSSPSMMGLLRCNVYLIRTLKEFFFPGDNNRLLQ